MSACVDAAAPFPGNVRAFTTVRHGLGASTAPFDSFNLGNFRADDGDDPAVVARNRAELVQRFGLPSPPHWLKQVHGTDVVRFDAPAGLEARSEPEADAAVTSIPGVVLAILTADCLPVLFCDVAGTCVAAAHAGWRGLVQGVLAATIAAMRRPGAELLAWLGPAIEPSAFEVGDEVREQFLARAPESVSAFVRNHRQRWQADLYSLARQELARAGITRVFGGGFECFADRVRFFSYRREARTGRMATLIWLEPPGPHC